jgi:hypothetical protein
MKEKVTMKTKHHCYKAVYEFAGYYGSLVVRNTVNYFTMYALKEKTVPLLGELFVFEDMELAVKFAVRYIELSEKYSTYLPVLKMEHAHILRCECGRLKPIETCSLRTDSRSLVNWWRSQNEPDTVPLWAWDGEPWGERVAPVGSYITPWVIPLEVVW